MMITQIFPIFAILALGWVLRQKFTGFNDYQKGIEWLILNIALPCALFNNLVAAELNAAMLVNSGIMFLLLCTLYLSGALIARRFPQAFQDHYTAFFFTSFEFGMIGLAVGAVFLSSEALLNFIFYGIGHILFYWLLFAPTIKSKTAALSNNRIMKQHVWKSPTILAVLLAILLNVTGAYRTVSNLAVVQGFITGTTWLSQIALPLILLVVGSMITFKDIRVSDIVKYVGLRILLTAVLGAVFLMILTRIKGTANAETAKAFWLFVLLPVGFVMPIFIEDDKSRMFYSRLIPINAFISCIFIGVFGFFV